MPKGTFVKTKQSNAEIFGWSAPEADVPMRPANTHVCFLTHVRGNLGGNSTVAVHRAVLDLSLTHLILGITGASGETSLDDSGAIWKIGGWQGTDNSLSGEATCVFAGEFRGDPNAGIFCSQTFGTTAKSTWPGCSETKTVPMWSNAAIGYVTGLRGNFEGGGEKVEIVGATIGTGPKQLRVRTEQCGDYDSIEGLGRSFFVGTNYTLRGNRVSLTTSSGPRKTRLYWTSSHICYLTKISGDFDGAPESARIFPEMDAQGREWWAFEVKKGGGSVYAEAECVPYDQRTPPELL